VGFFSSLEILDLKVWKESPFSFFNKVPKGLAKPTKQKCSIVLLRHVKHYYSKIIFITVTEKAKR